MRAAIALRHVPFEDLGLLAPLLARRGWETSYRDAAVDAFDTDAIAAAELLIVLGGPIGAYEESAYPWLGDEVRTIARRLAAGKPTLGICLGSQLMARALGARVYPGPVKEIGWAPLTLAAAGRRSCLAAVGDAAVLHWHGDTFDLPDGATLLASTPLYRHQAFAWRDHALALQCHLEATAAGLERWYIGHAAEIAATPDLDVARLRAAAHRHAPALAPLAERCFTAWLDGLG
ncbi:MAG TPA: glutamine amidotransferase [Stellaceae bacterium]|jgi:GMP synthase (glutamine-hydrolysing)|nr:glutamine amidotransferase [Stellaceae bacterium]